MKFTIATVLASLALTSASTFEHQTQFATFKKTHMKTYASKEEHASRFQKFVNNVEENARKNSVLKSKGLDEIHGVTKFSDLTQEEFTDQYLGAFNPNDAPLYPVVNHFPVRVDTAVTGAYNLADDNLLTAVKDQAQCGSCWVSKKEGEHPDEQPLYENTNV